MGLRVEYIMSIYITLLYFACTIILWYKIIEIIVHLTGCILNIHSTSSYLSLLLLCAFTKTGHTPFMNSSFTKLISTSLHFYGKVSSSGCKNHNRITGLCVCWYTVQKDRVLGGARINKKKCLRGAQTHSTHLFWSVAFKSICLRHKCPDEDCCKEALLIWELYATIYQGTELMVYLFTAWNY